MKGKFLKKGVLFIAVAACLITGNAITAQAQEVDSLENTFLGDMKCTEIEGTDKDVVADEVIEKSYQDHAPSKWDVYGSTFYYEQLNAEQKAYYNSIYDSCVVVMNSAEDAKLAPGIIVDTNSISEADFFGACAAVYLDNPQFYFWEFDFYADSERGIFYPKIVEDYQNGAVRAETTKKIFNLFDTWIAELSMWNSDYGKERKAHDLLCQYTEPVEDNMISIADIALKQKGWGVAYEYAFSLLCNASGVDCAIVPLESSGAGNIIKINGVWYNVSVYEDDMSSSDMAFNITDEKASEYEMDKYEIFGESTYPACNTTFTYPAVNCVYGGIDYSAVFNPYYYLTQNPDVATVYRDNTGKLLEHFVNCGMSEGRCANAGFNVIKYMYGLLNDDLRAAYGGDMKQYYYHYMNYGRYEGRSVSDYDSVFDAEYYLANNPDVKENLIQRYTSDGNLLGWALWHYYEYGMNEGRRGNATFGVYNYEAANPDVYKAYRTNYRQATIHYIQNGAGRAICGNIDIYSMSTLRPDVYAAYNGNPDAMIDWYILYGNSGM